MTVHRKDLTDLHQDAKQKLAETRKVEKELEDQYTEIQLAIRHNNEQMQRAAKTVSSLDFLIKTLEFDEDDS